MSERTKRRVAGTAVTVWLLGFAPSFYFSQNVQGGPDVMPQLYAIWIILMPCALCALYGVGWLLLVFYEWVFDRNLIPPRPPQPRETQAQRIARLERELGIHD